LEYAYRKLNFPIGEIIVSIKIQLEKEKPGIVNKRITENLKKRNATQPLDMPSGGSVFKNPPGDYAGRLIERAGLKGKRSGGAMISHKHANFIVNTGDAKAQDVLSLITLVRKEVKARSGINLEPELHVIGDSV
jgi:UDP-N-acetylmuramate dehydrogenase